MILTEKLLLERLAFILLTDLLAVENFHLDAMFKFTRNGIFLFSLILKSCGVFHLHVIF